MEYLSFNRHAKLASFFLTGKLNSSFCHVLAVKPLINSKICKGKNDCKDMSAVCNGCLKICFIL